ncbi:hypothetical protein H0W26_04470 [Candidatus Dependentiae bacterium]|nr:hypothetical protein [Candidatus Dependentiae bacterium]
MIKNYRVLGLVCLWGTLISSAPSNRELRKLRDAIAASDESMVAGLVKKRGLITQENRQQLLDEAEEKVAYYEDNVSLWTTKKDSAMFFSGLFLGLVGTGMFVGGIWKLLQIDKTVYSSSRHEQELAGGALTYTGFLSSLLGLNIGIFGFKGTTTTLLIKKSEEVLRLLERARVVSDTEELNEGK